MAPRGQIHFQKGLYNKMLKMITVIKIRHLKENSFPNAEAMAVFLSDSGIAPSKTPCGQRYLQKNGSPIPMEFVTSEEV